jgi:hypothetical protein
MTDERRPWTAPQVMAAVAVVLAVAGAVWLIVWPCAYSGVTAISSVDGVEESRTTICRSFLDVNDASVLLILLVPVVLAAAGFVGARTGRRGVFMAAAVLLLLFCFLGSFSVGLWFIPSAIAMLIGIAWTSRPGPRRA